MPTIFPSYITTEISHLYSCDYWKQGANELWVQSVTGVTRMCKCLRNSMLLASPPHH